MLDTDRSRLTALAMANERLHDELAANRARIAATQERIDSGCAGRIEVAYLAKCQARRAEILAELRRNMGEAQGLFTDHRPR